MAEPGRERNGEEHGQAEREARQVKGVRYQQWCTGQAVNVSSGTMVT